MKYLMIFAAMLVALSPLAAQQGEGEGQQNSQAANADAGESGADEKPASAGDAAKKAMENVEAQAGELKTKSQEWMDEAIDLGISYLPKVIGAVVALAIGWFVVGWVVKLATAALRRSKVDRSLEQFLTKCLRVVLRVLLLVMVASMVGIKTTSLVAMLGAAGLAVGMALSGALQNFAGGVIVLLQRPFKVGDLLEVSGVTGTVEEIGLFHTELVTVDTKRVMIPNGDVISSVLTNYSRHPERRLDLTYSAGYQDSMDEVRAAIERVLEREERILRDKAEPIIKVRALGESSVDYLVRAWVKTDDFFAVSWDLHEAIKREFDECGLDIPFPQRVLHNQQGG